jgi:hypothetical protein
MDRTGNRVKRTHSNMYRRQKSNQSLDTHPVPQIDSRAGLCQIITLHKQEVLWWRVLSTGLVNSQYFSGVAFHTSLSREESRTRIDW